MTGKPKNPKESKLKFYSPDGNYKAKITKRYGEMEKTKENRTLKGLIQGAKKPVKPTTLPKEDSNTYIAKNGGTKKSKNKTPLKRK